MIMLILSFLVIKRKKIYFHFLKGENKSKSLLVYAIYSQWPTLDLTLILVLSVRDIELVFFF